MYTKVVVSKQVPVAGKAQATRRILAKTEPGIIKWLRESYGWTIDEVANGMKTTTKIIVELESGEKRATLGQLRRMAGLFKCPLAAFLLPEPAEEPPLPKDHRLLQGRNGVFDKKTILVIKRSRSLQDTSRELLRDIRRRVEPRIKKISKMYDPHTVASEHRRLFGLTWERQGKFSNAYEMFKHIRHVMEKRRVHVFDFSMPLRDAGGFTLADKSPAIIVVNSEYDSKAKLFALMHEFAHLLRRETVIDTPLEGHTSNSDVERWCDMFSTSFLLPEQKARKIFNENPENLLDARNLSLMSEKHKISKKILLRKMLDLNRISTSQFNRTLEVYGSHKNGKNGSEKTIMSPSKRCIFELGGRFVDLVADNFERNLITYADALDYLSIQSKSFESAISEVRT